MDNFDFIIEHTKGGFCIWSKDPKRWFVDASNIFYTGKLTIATEDGHKEFKMVNQIHLEDTNDG
jgi:hypothetical protein